MSVNFTNLFTTWGKAINTQANAVTYANQRVYELVSLQTQFNSLTPTPSLQPASDSLMANGVVAQNSLTEYQQSIQQFIQAFLVDMYISDAVANNTAMPDATIEAVLSLLITQMIGNGTLAAPQYSVRASSTAVTGTISSAAAGNGVIVTSKYRNDGQASQYVYNEDITLTATSDLAFDVSARPLVSPKLAYNWWIAEGNGGGGSGATGIVPSVGASSESNLIANGTFDTSTIVANAPDGWILAVGSAGVDSQLTTLEVQTVVISGSPTSGTYQLTFTNSHSKVQTTAPIAYNADGPTVQTALRLLDGLQATTVGTTGTTPNFTHTITFTGLGGNIAQLTSINNTGQTISHNTTVAGTPFVYSGSYALEFVGDGSTLTQFRQLVGVAAGTQYAVNGFWIAGTTSQVDQIDIHGATAGDFVWSFSESNGTSHAITIGPTFTVNAVQALINTAAGNSLNYSVASGGTGKFNVRYTGPNAGINIQGLYGAAAVSADTTTGGTGVTTARTTTGGTVGAPAAGVAVIDLWDGSAVINDDFGTANSFNVTLTGITTSWVAHNSMFRLPSILPRLVYLRVRLSTAITLGNTVFLDELAMAQATELYPSGPFSAVFSGNTPWQAGDVITISTSNTPSSFQLWLDRNFDLDTLKLQIPSKTSSETFADSLIA